MFQQRSLLPLAIVFAVLTVGVIDIHFFLLNECIVKLNPANFNILN